MSTLRIIETIAQGATVANLLSGSILERLEQAPEIVSIYGVMQDGEATAPTDPALCKAEFRVSSTVVIDDASIPYLGSDYAGRPDRDKDLLGRAMGRPFALLQLRVSNATDQDVTVAFLVETSRA